MNKNNKKPCDNHISPCKIHEKQFIIENTYSENDKNYLKKRFVLYKLPNEGEVVK